MHIRLATSDDRTTWDAYVLAHPDGLAYQLFAWQEAVRCAYRFKTRYLIAEENSVLRGILPLIDFRIPFISRSLLSLPYCDAGGVLADSEKISRQLIDHAQSMAAKVGADCQVRSIDPLPHSLNNRTDKVRMLLELPASAEQLLAALDAKVRNQIRKPVRDGLTAKLGGHELIDDFYQIFAENMRDLGSPVHSRQWIDAIVSAYGERCRVAVVYTPDGLPAAAGVVLIHPSTMSIPWASSLRRFNRLNSNMLLYWIFLSLAIDSGCRQFDFGRSTPGEGTYRFKQQWGAEPKPLYWETYPLNKKTSPINSQASGVRAFAENIWRRMPLPVCNTLGPMVRRCVNL